MSATRFSPSLGGINAGMNAAATPTPPLGVIKTFGPIGPKYEVGRAVRRLEDGDWLIEVTLVESGEKTEYRLSRLAADPVAI